jgi:ribosomal protein S27E
MGYQRKKTESDFEQMRCAECGGESGTFYIDTDDNEVLCLDCVMNLPSDARSDFERALEESTNWEQQPNRNGLLLLRCVHCHEMADEDFGREDDDGALYAATEFLEKDEDHQCDEEEDDDGGDRSMTVGEFVQALIDGGTTNIEGA